MVRLSAIRAYPIDDFDMRFDQRQNGTENIRLRIDGVLIGLPSSFSSSAGSVASNVAANYLLELAAAAEDDDNDTDNYFNFLKNSNDASATETAPVSGNKNTGTSTKDEKLATPIKQGEMKNVVIVKENEETKFDEKQSFPLDHEQVETEDAPVVPVKEIQSRRRNK